MEKDGKKEVLEDSHCEQIEPKPETEHKCNLRPCGGVDWITTEYSGVSISFLVKFYSCFELTIF